MKYERDLKLTGNAVGQHKKSIISAKILLSLIRQTRFEENLSRLFSQNLRHKFSKHVSLIREIQARRLSSKIYTFR